MSTFLIAVGAILRFAVQASVDGIDLRVTGVILMIVGVVGLVISLAFWSSFSPSRRRGQVVGTSVVREVETTSTNNRETV